MFPAVWALSSCASLPFYSFQRERTNKLSKCKNYREFSFFFSNPISANTHWWRSLKSPDSFPYHRTTVTDTNSTDLEVESYYKRIWCPTTKIKNVQCGCAPVTTQFIWMLVKKLKKKKTLLHHLLNSRHRWQDGIPSVQVFRRLRAHSVTLEALITSYHLFLASLGRKFQRNKLFQSSKSSVLW